MTINIYYKYPLCICKYLLHPGCNYINKPVLRNLREDKYFRRDSNKIGSQLFQQVFIPSIARVKTLKSRPWQALLKFCCKLPPKILIRPQNWQNRFDNIYCRFGQIDDF